MEKLKSFFLAENPNAARKAWVIEQLKGLPQGAELLDAGCGPQPFRPHCEHLSYKAQDFGQYVGDDGEGNTKGEAFSYGKLDYACDIWEIPAKDNTFDAILCTEVFEHIPYPTETIAEFSRLLKPRGTLILTAPYACLPHMEPYFFYSGFSREYYEKFFALNGLELVSIEENGNQFSFVHQELRRAISVSTNPLYKAVLWAGLLVLGPILKCQSRNATSTEAKKLHFGFHIVARKAA